MIQKKRPGRLHATLSVLCLVAVVGLVVAAVLIQFEFMKLAETMK